MAEAGEIRMSKKLPALELWRKMLTRVFETGHPWITWKDPSNIRSPQDHCGVVHSSNLCTEILLNTSATETAVCNLGSINLLAHIVDGQFDLLDAGRDCPHRDANAGQRDRHQLLSYGRSKDLPISATVRSGWA